ncbi:MAG TPA: tellurite resistance/C4-dicarboxylate transporter family protein [Mycobacteriales bacterium]|nr:tellurite resistance/C4-dicarboxylate transporter family protein [Mycobacteriales bacterium]
MNVRGGALRDLYPGYFALAMATGITSTVLHEIGHRTTSSALLIVDIACFVILCVLYAARAARYPSNFVADIAAPDRAFAFFTFVAACNVLGVRLALDGHRWATLALAIVSAVAWLALSYGVPAQLILGPRPRPVLAGVNGTWFIWVVGTQSISIAASLLERGESASTERAAALAATLMWSVGVVLYLIVATMVLVRLLLLELTPDDLSPPYWIAMGATAITVLAAARLLQMDATPVTIATRPIVVGLGVILWAFGTWLIPMLVVFSFWRFSARQRFSYAPPLWSVVFPLGMYAAASLELGRAAHLPLVHSIGHVAGWVAVVVWAFVFALMLWALRPAQATP